jgi:hypothetical protein
MYDNHGDQTGIKWADDREFLSAISFLLPLTQCLLDMNRSSLFFPLYISQINLESSFSESATLKVGVPYVNYQPSTVSLLH